eukprot:scaffold49868_cov20-Tisochrysis_lutea.AAC.1
MSYVPANVKKLMKENNQIAAAAEHSHSLRVGNITAGWHEKDFKELRCAAHGGLYYGKELSAQMHRVVLRALGLLDLKCKLAVMLSWCLRPRCGCMQKPKHGLDRGPSFLQMRRRMLPPQEHLT